MIKPINQGWYRRVSAMRKIIWFFLMHMFRTQSFISMIWMPKYPPPVIFTGNIGNVAVKAMRWILMICCFILICYSAIILKFAVSMRSSFVMCWWMSIRTPILRNTALCFSLPRSISVYAWWGMMRRVFIPSEGLILTIYWNLLNCIRGPSFLNWSRTIVLPRPLCVRQTAW